MRNMAKITLRDGTVIEGTSEAIAELAERLNGEEIEGEGELKTVKRAAEVGERVLITEAYIHGGRYDNGDILTVVHDANNDSEGVTVDANGMKAYVLHNEYEVIVEDEEDAIEEGDIVKLLSTDEPTLQGFNAGDVCTVTGAYESIIMRGTRLEIYNADNRLGYCSPEKVVKLNGKIEVGDEVILDAGDDEDSYPLNGCNNGVDYKGPSRTRDEEQEGLIELGDNSRGNPGSPTLDQVNYHARRKISRKAISSSYFRFR